MVVVILQHYNLSHQHVHLKLMFKFNRTHNIMCQLYFSEAGGKVHSEKTYFVLLKI